MSASQMALRGRLAQLEQDNVELRIALARTTKQLAETLEEYKLLRVPLWRRWRMRRLMKRRKEELQRAYLPCKLCGGEIGPDVTGRPMCYGCGPEEMRPKPEPMERTATFGDMMLARARCEEVKARPPLIIVPGR